MPYRGWKKTRSLGRVSHLVGGGRGSFPHVGGGALKDEEPGMWNSCHRSREGGKLEREFFA